MSILRSFSVPEEAFESFQAASIIKEMDMNSHKVTIPACASNVEISSTIEDGVQSVNSTSISHKVAPSLKRSKRCSKPKAVENIAINSTVKDQQVSTTQEFSESVNEEGHLHPVNQEKQINLETKPKSRRSRGRPRKSNVRRPEKQTSLVEKDENKTMPSDQDEATDEGPIIRDHAVTENEVVDSTTSQISNKTNINLKEDREENNINIEVGNNSIDTEQITNSISVEVKSSNASLNKIDNVTNVNQDCIETHGFSDNDNDPDEISLSKLKKTLALVNSEDTNVNIIEINVKKPNKITKRQLSNIPSVSHLVSSIDSITGGDSDNSVKMQTDKNPLIDSVALVEGSSGRPKRKRGKLNFHYDDGSDEDPFANVELSDDDGEPRRLKKGKRCYSDDDYIPDEMREKKKSTDSDIEKDDEESKKPRRRKNSKGLKKKKKNSDLLDTIQSIDISLCNDELSHQDEKDVEVSFTNSHVKKNSASSSWGNTNEFENFLSKRIQGTNLEIKRVTNKENSSIAHLEIPVINSYKKTANVYSQTNPTQLANAAVQTTSHYEVQMDKNVPLTSIQAEKACEFLTDMVKATSKLGELMTQKSDDFIQKKINTGNLPDTIKMDHYVKKSLLLFKLAKDSIMDIEQNLASKYNDFLKEHKLSRYTTVPKLLPPTVALKDDDSDCEIVEETVDSTKQNVRGNKPSKLNLKTVFLNKELSIKIAKKPSEEQKIQNKINIKGRNSMWISDSVLVKKVKPTQSFLAQDGRNKKPPDSFVTKEMVSDFFKKYQHATALSTCAHLVTTEWQYWRKLKISQNRAWCYYFNVEPTNNNLRYFQSSVDAVNNNTNTNENCDTVTKCKNPKRLFLLSIQALQKNMIQIKYDDASEKEINYKSNAITDLKENKNAEKLSDLCLYKIKHICNSIHPNTDTVQETNSLPEEKVSCLKMLCYRQMVKDFSTFTISKENIETCINQEECGYLTSENKNTSLLFTSDRKLKLDKSINADNKSKTSILKSINSLTVQTVAPLQTLCYHSFIQHQQKNNTSLRNKEKKIDHVQCYDVNTLSSLCLNIIKYYQKKKNSNKQGSETQQVERLSSLCLNVIHSNQKPTVGSVKNNKLNRESSTVSTKRGEITDSMYDDHSLTIEQSDEINDKCKNIKLKHFELKSLKHIALSSLLHNITNNRNEFIGDVDPKAENRSHTITIHDNCLEQFKNVQYTPEATSLKSLFQNCFEKVKLIYESNNVLFHNSACNSIQINSVNTIPEEVFFNFQEGSSNLENCNVNGDIEKHCYDDHLFDTFNEVETNIEDCNFESKQPMEEISTQTNHYKFCDYGEDTSTTEINNTSAKAQIKIEPIDDYMQEKVAEIKTEPDLETNLMPRIQCIQAAKLENCFESPNITRGVLSCSSADFNYFESLINGNVKPLVAGYKNNHEQKVFSQSSLRVRRQFEPDSDNENDNNMSLLIPNTYEQLDNLMIRNIMPNLNHALEKEEKNEKKKKKNEKRIEKKKNKQKSLILKDVDGVEVVQLDKESDVIKEKLHNKITKIEHEAESSDSDSLSVILSSRRKNKPRVSSEKELQTKSKQISTTSEIQCNNVDSTQEMNAEPNSEKNKIEEFGTSVSPAFNFDEPIELLQCEPTLLFLDNIVENRKSKNNKKRTESVESNIGHKDLKASDSNQNTFRGKYNVNDIKLCQHAVVALEKLPEKFVEIYLKSQGITFKNKDENMFKRVGISSDENICDRLKTTVRSNTLDKDIMIESNGDIDSINNNASSPDVHICESRRQSPKPEDCDEMELEQLVKKEEEENRLREYTSDDDLKYTKTLRSRKHSKKHMNDKIEQDVSESNDNDTLLTADRVMKKDLQLLHAPIQGNELSTDSSKDLTRSKRKLDGIGHKDTTNPDDYSSSEEEKQWVSTKEKLLKQLLKKQDDLKMSAAKRAKVVNEFIARCKTIESRKRYSRNGRSRRKNFLERQKQLSVLTKELFGETSNETYQLGKKSSQSFGKGRRNIRRVIDKKSLARSTLLANIEEIERKRRLISRQNRLRELLGCEEGVNVVVINDEVCLEYDFEENRPVVTVHPFFTQVMKAHQYEGVKFMWDSCFESLELVGAGHAGGGCILAHCMGLGKTLQVLALLHTVLTHPSIRMQRVLVVCPLSTVINWVDEINKWMEPVNSDIKVFELSKLKKTYERAYQLEDWYNGGGIFIMGYEMFRNLSTLDAILDDIRPTVVNKIRTALLDPGPDIIICDEGHLLKNDSSVLAVAISRITTKRRIVLTGTPMQNNLREYYCMVNFVKPNLLGLYSEYANRFENPIINGQHRDSREEDIKLMKARTHILHKVLEGCLQRQEAAVLYPYLPKKHEYTVFIPLTNCQKDLYKHYLKNYAKQAKHNVLRDYHILQKIWTHPQVLHNFQLKSRDSSKIKVEKLEDDLECEDLTASEDVKPSPTEVWWLEYLEGGNMLDSLESSNKLYAAFRILDECIELGDKVLIFSTSLFTMDALEYFLKSIKKWSLGREYYRLDGSVPAEVRQNWCRDFNAPHNITTNLFLISTRTGSLGLNMTAANRVIILDTSWNPAHDIQSIFRVYRFGQKKDCYVYRFVAMGTMEQKIYERSVTKQAVACRVVDSQQIDRHYNMDELTELYKFDETGSSVESGVAASVTDVALLRVARDAPLHAVYEHDSLLRDSHDQQLPEHERAAAWRQFEMEQGHSQISNLDNILLRTATKNIHRNEYTLSPSRATDYTNNAIIKPKGKRGKKSKLKTSKDTNKDEVVEENLSFNDDNITEIQQIKNILIEENVHNEYNDISKIENLVNCVQRVVEARLAGQTSNDGPLVESIAKVFLQMKSKDIQIPTTSNVLNERTSDDYQNIKKRKHQVEINETNNASNEGDESYSGVESKKRKHQVDINETNNARNEGDESYSGKESKNRKHQVEINETNNASNEGDESYSGVESKKRKHQVDINETNNASNEGGESDSRVRCKKSKAAAIGTEYISSLHLKGTKDKKDDEDEGWSQEENTDDLNARQREGNQSDSDSECQPTVDLRSCDEITDEDDTGAGKSEKYKTVMVDIPDDDDPTLKSIILSDDETDPEMEKTESARNAKDCDENERVPLHPSLLKNQNFINVVAYRYLEGNPLLDKDAAVHAARYSAQKALKEIEDTGQDLCSGPLYDIAVKSIGMDTLKRLYNVSKTSNPESDSAKQNTGSSTNDQLASQSTANQSKDDGNKSKRVYQNKFKEKAAPARKSVRARRQERKDSTDSDDIVLVTEEVTCETPKRKKSISNKINGTEHESLQSATNKIATLVAAPAPSTSRTFDIHSNLCTEPDRAVPIQLIKRSSNPTITMARPTTPVTDECILPDDDDDVCFVTDTATASTSEHTSSQRSGDTYTRNNVTTPAAPKKTNFVQPIIVLDEVLHLPNNPTKSTVEVNNYMEAAIRQIDNCNMICLDSDDEDKIVTSKETQASTLHIATSSRVAQPPDPVFVSVTAPRTKAIPSKQSQSLTSQAESTRCTIGNTTPSSQPTTLSFSNLHHSTNNISGVVGPNANGICKPGDVIKINKAGEIFVMKPNQTSATRLLTNPTPKSIPNTPTILSKPNVTIKVVKLNTPSPANARGGSMNVPSVRGAAEQSKPTCYPQTAPKLTILPLLPTKSKAQPSLVVPETETIKLYYPNKKNKIMNSKRNNEVISECHDLTHTDNSDVAKTAINKGKLTKVVPRTSNVKTSVPEVGSPKDFMIVRAGDRTTIKTIQSRKPNGQFSFNQKVKVSEDPGPSNKPKIPPFKKLSLHDFNIDKIDDDIIELE